MQEVWIWDVRQDPCEQDFDALAFKLEGVGRRAVWYHSGKTPPRYSRVLETDDVLPFDVAIPYGAMQATVLLPRRRLAGRGSVLGDFRTVAADVKVTELTGHDPRLVAHLPDDERFADLLDWVSDNMVRARRPTDRGFVSGVGVTDRSINVQLHRKSEVFRRLFGAGGVVTGQSDVGLFQTRAAEMLGGAASGALTQPGLAAALQLLATHQGGIPLARLREEIKKGRGRWPMRLSQTSVADYVESVLRRLLNSGLVTAVLVGKCTFCRASMHIGPSMLGDHVACDFCGQDVRLASLIGGGGSTAKVVVPPSGASDA